MRQLHLSGFKLRSYRAISAAPAPLAPTPLNAFLETCIGPDSEPEEGRFRSESGESGQNRVRIRSGESVLRGSGPEG